MKESKSRLNSNEYNSHTPNPLLFPLHSLAARGCRFTYENHKNNPMPSFYMTIEKTATNLFDLSTGNINLKIFL